MTAVGKALAIFNLLFSMVLCGLIVIVYSTRTNWKNEYEKARNLAQVAEAAYKAEKNQHENDIKGKDVLLAEANAERDAYRKKWDDAENDKKLLVKQRDDALANHGSETTNNKLVNEELVAIRKEREDLVKDRQMREGQIVKLQGEVNEQRKLSANLETQNRSYLQRVDRMLARVEEVEKENRALKSQLGSTATASNQNNQRPSSVLNPPPEPAPSGVRGTVTSVAGNGLTQVNIGSDVGLRPGNTLDVYRLDPVNPAASVYLGKLTIQRVNPKAAVGQFQALNRIKLPREGDVVDSSLGGGR